MKKIKRNNRFHIDVRSNGMTVGDMQWAQILFWINMFLEAKFPEASAYLKEYEEEP